MTYSFWIVSGLVTIAVALALCWPLLRPRKAGGGAEDLDIQIYRDQLQSVERDIARGVVTSDEAERLKTEIKRRILEADTARVGDARSAPPALSVVAAGAAGLAVIVGSFLLYGRLGAPGYGDLPIGRRLAEAERARAERPDQADLEARIPAVANPEISEEYADLVEKLRTAVKENPDELEGWVLLARNESSLGNMAAAHAAQQKVIEIKGANATDQDYVALAALMIQAAGGTISSESADALKAALERNPHNLVAQYYAGLGELQTGRPDLAFGYWEPLLRASPPDAPWVPIVRSRLESLAAMAGIRYSLPPLADGPPAGGPTADDMAAAADMTPAERQDFIRSMVERLAARIDEEGGAPTDWARLIGAYGVLGDTESAAAAWADAQQTFTDAAEIAPIRQAAAQAGVEDVGADGAGPTQSDVDAAAEMEPEDRQAMIRAMVDQLGERLATEGGPPSDWARLVRAHGVLGNTDRAAAIWAEAQQTFASQPEALEAIRQAAVDAGVAD